MPLFTEAQTVHPLPPSPPPETQPPVIDTASMYSNFQLKDRIVGYLDGTPWTGIYYAQFLGHDDVVINANDVSDPTLKQYLKIDGFELRVTTPLTSSVDPQSGLAVVSGNSNVYPVITPVAGDIFIGEIEAGVFGVFEITAFERATQFLESAWTITYHQTGYVSNEVLDELDSHVVGELQFDATRLDTGSNPLLTKTEHDRVQSKEDLIQQLVTAFYLEFFDVEMGTFLVPNVGEQTGNHYDPFLVGFWNTFVGAERHPQLPSPVAYGIDTAIVTHPFITVFDAVKNQSSALLKQCVKSMRRADTDYFNAPFQRNSIRVSSIDYVVFPYVVSRKAELGYGEDDSYDSYIFSRAFYANGVGQSPLETQLSKLLAKAAVSFLDVEPLVTGLDAVTPIERFYHTPFLITLLFIAR